MKAEDICMEAANLVAGDRNETHGDIEKSYAGLARQWSAYLTTQSGHEIILTRSQAADMMGLMKVNRRLFGTTNIDDYVDGAGYDGIAGQLACGPGR